MPLKSEVFMMNTQQNKSILSDLFRSALNAVNGRFVVEQQLQSKLIKGNVAIVAVGKAAAAMMLGAQTELKDQIQSALVITKEGYMDKFLSWPYIEAGHPIPNQKSLEAGEKLLEFIGNIPIETTFLALISGGASALVEVLPKNMDLTLLQKMNNWLLGSGLEIDEMNKIRQSVSSIKRGKALNYLPLNKMTQFLISDVKENDITIIGSGLFVISDKNHLTSHLPDWLKQYIQAPKAINKVSVESTVIASNEMACQEIVKQAKEKNYSVMYHGKL